MENETSELNINSFNFKSIFLSDKPLENLEDDELDRENFSKHLGEIILKYDCEEELILGICGEWGSGKTSVIKMALEYIKENDKSEKDLHLINFNPWLFSNQNQLITKFFEELGSEIKDETFLNNLKAYVNKLVPPILGLATIINPQGADALLNAVKSIDDLQSEEESLESLKNKLNNMILKKDCKIIVVIDDIDRLNKIEMLQIFKLVKLLADFPNTIYLLAFDKNVVQKSLEDINEFKGLDYLKKVVPIMIDIPSISENDLREMYRMYITRLIEGYPENRLLDIYDDFLKHFIKNIRDLKRFMNNLSFNLELVKKEVNLKDFMGITAIQVFKPDLYEDIWRNKEIFIYESPMDGLENAKKRQRKRFNEIIEKENELSHDKLIKILSIMFPKVGFLDEKYDILSTPGHLPREYKITKRIQFKEHFDTYFRFAVPKWELSSIEFESILRSEDINEFTDKFLNINDYKKFRFLEIIKARIGNVALDLEVNKREIPEEKLEMLFDFNMLKGNMLSQRVLDDITEISEFYIKSYDAELIKTKYLINISENPYTSVFLVDTLKPDEIDDLNELKSLCADKIEKYVRNFGLKDLNYPFYVALCWSKWDNEAKVRSIIESLDVANTRILISSFENTPTDVIELDELKIIHNLQSLKSKLDNLLNEEKLIDDKEKSNIKRMIRIIDNENE